MKQFIESKGTRLLANYETKKFVAKEKMKGFLQEEKGAADIVAVILIVLIAVGIALIFRDNIKKLVEDLFTKIKNEAKSI